MQVTKEVDEEAQRNVAAISSRLELGVVTATHPCPVRTSSVLFMIAVNTFTSSLIQPCSPYVHLSPGWSSLAAVSRAEGGGGAQQSRTA